ncbi:MAG: hypothetical protein KH704_11410 [Clostridiales bacterium]|nr:hypothetical protein [Clostridiales bacterium]
MRDQRPPRQTLRSAPDRVRAVLPGLAILRCVQSGYAVGAVSASTCGMREEYLLKRVMGVNEYA